MQNVKIYWIKIYYKRIDDYDHWLALHWHKFLPHRLDNFFRRSDAAVDIWVDKTVTSDDQERVFVEHDAARRSRKGVNNL